MKHNTKITLILILMFIITQLIGLFVINFYNNSANALPFGMEPPAGTKDIALNSPLVFISNLLLGFIIALTLFLVLTKMNADKFIKLWFFIVTVVALGLTLNVFLSKLNLFYAPFFALIFGFLLAYFKIFKRDILVHNFSELLIYPGIAAVFVPLLGIMGIIIFLLIISLYDIWAVWHSEVMQKMAKYQIDKLKFFAGFFIPYASKQQKNKIKKIKDKYAKKSDKFLEAQFKKAKIKINLAILGGGDVIFPIITAGVFYKVYASLPAALIITTSSVLALLGLFMLAKKGKFYPAMPFLTIGMYLGMIVVWILRELSLWIV